MDFCRRIFVFTGGIEGALQMAAGKQRQSPPRYREERRIRIVVDLIEELDHIAIVSEFSSPASAAYTV
jgi:hypothetical protein